jgi:hypothetical protein
MCSNKGVIEEMRKILKKRDDCPPYPKQLSEAPPVCCLCFKRQPNDLYWHVFFCQCCYSRVSSCSTCANDYPSVNICGWCAGDIKWPIRGLPASAIPTPQPILPPVASCSLPPVQIVQKEEPKKVEVVKSGWW